METNGIWTESLMIPSYMVDKDLDTTFVSIGNLFQEVAGNHAIFKGLGYFDMKEQNMMWVLNRFKIQMMRFPKWREKVVIKTWVSAMQPFSHRHTLLLDVEGNELGYGSALWIPLDAITHRPKRLVLNDNFTLIKNETPCGQPAKISDLTDLELSSTRSVQYTDLDFLNHVNNVQYINWILDDIYTQKGKPLFKTLEINFINECPDKNTVSIFSKQIEKECFYLLKRSSDDKEICKAHLY